MVKRTFLTRSTDKPRKIDDELSRWGTWNPAAGFFHRATRDVDFSSTPRDQDRRLVREGPHRAVPIAAQARTRRRCATATREPRRRFARYSPRAPDLAPIRQRVDRPRGPRHAAAAHLGRAQLDRGAWGWTLGAQDFSFGRLPARHRGVCPGAKSRWTWARSAPLQSRYPSPRIRRELRAASDIGLSARTALVRRRQCGAAHDGGLRTRTVALSLRPRVSGSARRVGPPVPDVLPPGDRTDLAPFCTMALADSRIERDLKIDGVSESVLYAAGVGPRPKGVDWAPWPDNDQTPTLTPPDHACRTPRTGPRRRSPRDR